jgi:hypothetical protein
LTGSIRLSLFALPMLVPLSEKVNGKAAMRNRQGFTKEPSGSMGDTALESTQRLRRGQAARGAVRVSRAVNVMTQAIRLPYAIHTLRKREFERLTG